MTVSIMGEAEVKDTGVGERKLRDSRKRFRKLVWMGLGIGVALGMTAGIVTGYSQAAQRAGDSGIGWLAWPVLIISAAIFAWYSRTYFRRIDELDLLDNLWASLIGLYAFVMLFPALAMLHEIGQVGPPRVEPLWWATIAAAAIAYGWRKLRHRF